MQVFQTSASYRELIDEISYYMGADTPLTDILIDWQKGVNNFEHYRKTYMLNKRQFEKLISNIVIADRVEPIDDYCYWHLKGKHYRKSDKVFGYNLETEEYDFISKLDGGVGYWWRIEFTRLELETLLKKLNLQKGFMRQLRPEPVKPKISSCSCENCKEKDCGCCNDSNKKGTIS